jgi:hypothetical protein
MSDSPRLVPDPPASAARFGDGGDYYWPGLATREPELVLAAWFFLAAEEELPELRASLRSEVYEGLPEDRTDLYLWRNEEDRWRLYEDDWAPPSWAVPPAGSSREKHPMLEGVLALRTWARRFRLTSHPLIEVAVQILLGWQEDEIAERNGKPPLSTSGWGRDFDILANGWGSLPDQERANLQQIDRWVVPYDPLAFLWVDLYERWDPRLETRRGFAQRITDDFARQLQHYLDKSERRLEDLEFQKVPRKAARHHLTWLVQHRLCGMTCEEIADRHAERNPQLESPPTGDAVSKAIRRTAVALQLV